ncbi:hypothetical protein DPMN_143111 [Dreissena polymorpha]|uniref:Transmembrane protein n=1 Tax=Dreissena polymorpha TaxID=45954 RepID=A0A9D4GCC0_DREPO|nr:hypothetical protein DPMN_143111 [Dreissena polymorpha]
MQSKSHHNVKTCLWALNWIKSCNWARRHSFAGANNCIAYTSIVTRKQLFHDPEFPLLARTIVMDMLIILSQITVKVVVFLYVVFFELDVGALDFFL